jgi:hypothetical protein
MSASSLSGFRDGRPTVPERRYQRLIDAHFAGRPSPAGEQDLRRHLVTCGPCRAYYDRHLLLERVDRNGALPMSERLGRGLGLSYVSPRAWYPWPLLGAGALAACVLLLFLGLHGTKDWQARGGKPGSQLLVYELGQGKAPQPVGPVLRRDSSLAFAYANIAHKQRLMVFAVDVDDSRRVYWYHPAWDSAADNPTALPIAGDDAVHEIPQAIAHRFGGRHVQLFGVFMDRPLSTREMEAFVADAPTDAERRLQLHVSGADVTRLDLDLAAAP